MAAAEIPVLSSQDRGLLLGDGLFETVKVEQGRLLFFRAHYERPKTSAVKLWIP